MDPFGSGGVWCRASVNLFGDQADNVFSTKLLGNQFMDRPIQRHQSSFVAKGQGYKMCIGDLPMAA